MLPMTPVRCRRCSRRSRARLPPWWRTVPKITHVDAPVSLRIVETQAVDLPGPEIAEGSNGRLGIGEQVQLHGRTRAGDDRAAPDALIDPAPRDAELLGELEHGQPAREVARATRPLQNPMAPADGPDGFDQDLAVPRPAEAFLRQQRGD